MKSLAVLIATFLVAALPSVSRANTYNVTGTADGAGTVTLISGSTYNASTLRAAVNAANATTGPHTINVPSGTYDLTLGELQLATNGNLTVTILGSGAPANTIIQHDTGTSIARVFNIDPSLLGGVIVTIQNVTISHGRNNDGNGGAGVICGYQGTPGSPDSTTFSNCLFFDNQVVGSTPTAVGGGIQNIGGTLLVTTCTFATNSAGLFSGGGIYYDSHSPSVGSCSIVSCNFTNNTTGDRVNGGGAVYIAGVSGSTLSIVGSSFGGNSATNTNSNGGAIIKFGGASLTVSNCAFVNNYVAGAGTAANSACGGAIDNAAGPMTIQYCRFVSNSVATSGHARAVFNDAGAGATLVADNNWWASNTGPGGLDLTGASISSWLKVTHYATPNAIAENASASLTASIVTNSAGAAIPLANLTQLLGLPIVFNNAVKGSVSVAQTSIQPSGTATATFLAGAIPGIGSADAVVDGAVATAPININCPAISGTVSGGGTICQGNSTSVTVTLSGGVGPYTVALNNGGGSITSASPVILIVSPLTTTTYSVSSATDSYGCLASVSGSATVNVNQISTLITPNPTSVCANSTGNTASAPAGLTSYGWSISNGTITGATNGANITYTAGTGGNVTLTLTVSNASGCSGTGFLNVPINSVPVATITLSPTSVPANAPGNQASGPAAMTSYAWTIDNGQITSPANAQSITYVAGASGHLTLGLTVFNASGCSASNFVSVPIISSPVTTAGWSFRTNYFPSITFTDVSGSTTMSMAFDGTNYWSCSGGSTGGVRLACYDTNGVLVNTYSPGLDFRSIFTDAAGTLFARAFNDNTIYQQTSPGVFVPSGITLAGPIYNSQSSIVLNGAGTEYVGMSNGVVSRWDPDGNLIGTVNLIGFGTLTNEANTQQNRGLGAFGNFWITYNGSGVVSMWDIFGHRLATATLLGAGTGFDSDFSPSYCNGKFFVVDVGNGLWRGYDVGNPGRVGIFGAPSGGAPWNTDVQNKISSLGLIPQVDAFLVSASTPVPTIADFQRYESVLVYSDTGFNNNTNVGNALASYIDEGGGVSLTTFAFWSSNALSMQGRLVTGGYLPFTTGGQASGTNLSLVPNVGSHPILNNVQGFTGGTASYINYPISITSTSTLVAHWNNGQPLISARDIAPGRIAGLNFYPPSSDVLSGGWPANQPGSLILANSLLWAGKAPPTIITGPAKQVIPAGGNVTFNVTAVGLPPLTYQWHRNGTNIAGATGTAFSFVAQPTNLGQYSVVVGNAYGLAISESTSLGTPLRFLSPTRLSLGAPFSLFIGTADGSPLPADRAARVSVYTAPIASLPFASWTLLNNPMVLSNGLLRVDGLGVTSSSSFFRAVEAP